MFLLTSQPLAKLQYGFSMATAFFVGKPILEDDALACRIYPSLSYLSSPF